MPIKKEAGLDPTLKREFGIIKMEITTFNLIDVFEGD